MTINLTDPANHPANGPLPVQRIERVIEALESSLKYRNGSSMDHFITDAVKGLRELRVSREAAAQPVAYRKFNSLLDWYEYFEYQGISGSREPLYAAPPAPVVGVIDETLVESLRLVQCMLDDYRESNYGHAQEWIRHISNKMDAYSELHGDDAYAVIKASMLNAEKLNQPVSETELLPPGYLLGHQDGLEWAAQMAEANHPQTGDWLHDDPIALAAAIRKGPDMPEFKSVSVDEDDNFYSWFGRFWHENYQQNNYTTSAKQMLGTMAEFAYRAGRESATRAGNSPVTPDGWVMVPEEPTHEMLEAGDAQFGTYDVYRRMIEAAPKEVG